MSYHLKFWRFTCNVFGFAINEAILAFTQAEARRPTHVVLNKIIDCLNKVVDCLNKVTDCLNKVVGCLSNWYMTFQRSKFTRKQS